MAWGLGYFGQPHILALFVAIGNPDDFGQARRTAVGWVFITLTAAVAVGITGKALLGGTLAPDSGETVFMVLVHRLVPPIVAGSLLAAMLAAIMSTADSQLLVASSAVTEDLYRLLFRKQVTEKELVRVSRSAVLAIAVIAFVIALDPESSVLQLVAYAWAGFGASFGSLVLLSLYWKRMTCNGAIAGIVSGGVTVIVWKQLQGGVFELYEIVPGFIVSMLVIVVVSLVGERPSEEVMKVFEEGV